MYYYYTNNSDASKKSIIACAEAPKSQPSEPPGHEIY